MEHDHSGAGSRGVNLGIAGILLLIADRKKPGRELDLANEIHRHTMDALQADARLLQADIASVGQALKHPLDSALPLIVPLATILMNALKKKSSRNRQSSGSSPTQAILGNQSILGSGYPL